LLILFRKPLVNLVKYASNNVAKAQQAAFRLKTVPKITGKFTIRL